MKVPAVMVIAVLLSGCGGGWMPEHKPVSREYAFGKDQAWRGLMDYFTLNSIQIKTIEKDSGVIYAERLCGGGEKFTEFANCGTGVGVTPSGHGSVGFNAFVVEQEDGTSKVTINADFSIPVMMYAVFTNVPDLRQCSSTGTLERSILNHVANFNS